jgi:arylsulfatase A-like enzyme
MLLPALLAALLSAAPGAVPVSQPLWREVAARRDPGSIGLVVLVTIDQLRGDYLARWGGQWTGAFRRILDRGLLFPRARQDHAVTETAPGHAVLLSGRSPVHTGIVLNGRGVPDPASPLVGATGPGASPRRFVGTTLVDWLGQRDSGFRFLSLSIKDRGAILPIGRARGPVFWYSGGHFTTSRYYADTLPAWLAAWNDDAPVVRLAGRQWDLLLPDSAYPERDDAPWENGGADNIFPHRLPADPAQAARRLADTPWGDSLTLDLALAGARALALGRRGRPDLLVVSLSSTDYIGHAYGPDSRELHDQLLRLDRTLGAWLDSLEAQAGPGRVLMVLTADHGVTEFPEARVARGEAGGRASTEALLLRLNRDIAARAGDTIPVGESSGLFYADLDRLRAAGIAPDSLADALAGEVGALHGVTRAWTRATLARASSRDVHAQRWRRSLPADFPWLVCASLRPGYIWADAADYTTHGTTNEDDVSVPIAWLGGGIRPGRVMDRVRTIDIAPTLAVLLRVTPAEPLDGRVIRRVVQ